MKFLKLNSDQHVSLVPRCNCSVFNAIDDAISFIIENELKGADLLFDGFEIGIYQEDFKNRRPEFIHDLEIEFNSWKKLNLKNKQSKPH